MKSGLSVTGGPGGPGGPCVPPSPDFPGGPCKSIVDEWSVHICRGCTQNGICCDH